VVGGTKAFIAASKSIERNIIYQNNNFVYRYTGGKFVADASKPQAKTFASVSPDGRHVSSCQFNSYNTEAFCSTQDAGGNWVAKTLRANATLTAAAIHQIADELFVEMVSGQPIRLRHGSDGATATYTTISSKAISALDAKASMACDVVITGAHYTSGHILFKDSKGAWQTFDSGKRVDYNTGCDLTGDGKLVVFPHTDGTYVYERQGDAWVQVAKLPASRAVGISNDGNVLATLLPGASVQFYRRTSGYDWKLFRTGPAADKGASLSYDGTSVVVDPSGLYVVACIETKGMVIYHASESTQNVF
jgi:hypothetical protein